jgi:bacterioferritin-associated ferredoxin
MYVCVCHAVTDKQLREAISQGSHSLRDLRRQLGVITSCGKCGRCVREILQQSRSAVTATTAEVSNAA